MRAKKAETSAFHDAVVLVTGAASGIGQAQAATFLHAGARVFAVDLVEDFSKLQQLAKDMGAAAEQRLAVFQGDVSQKGDCLTAVATCEEQFGEVTILLNTAGKLDGYKNILDTSDELWRDILRTDLDSVYYLTKAVLPKMLEQGRGTIINMASVASFVGGGGGIAYTTAKHAIAGFTRQLALDYAAANIHVVAIAPGAIRTPMNAADFAGDGKMAAWVAAETPVKRWAEAQEVADLTLFLASQKAGYMQGNIVEIDGGWLLK